MIVCMAHAIQLKNYTLIWIRKQKADDLEIRNCRATKVFIRREDIQLDFWHGQQSNRLYGRSEKTTSVIQTFTTESNNATHCKHIAMGADHRCNCFRHSIHRLQFCLPKLWGDRRKIGMSNKYTVPIQLHMQIGCDWQQHTVLVIRKYTSRWIQPSTHDGMVHLFIIIIVR